MHKPYYIGPAYVITNKFETAALAVIILTYLNLVVFMQLWGTHETRLARAMNAELKEIKLLLGKEDERDEELKRELREGEEKVEQDLQIMFYMNAFFNFIIYVIALVNLFWALSN